MDAIVAQGGWIDRARRVLPAGGFGNFDPGIVIGAGRGARVWDEDGTEYIDLLIGSGPMVLGHGHPEVVEAVREQAGRGMTFFASNALGIELAEEICRAVPCADRLRYVSTGGEADMYAMRLARAHTGRDKILKFEGGYHDMSAEALMSLFPLEAPDFPRAQPDSAGIPAGVADTVIIAPYNDIDDARRIIETHGHEIAGVIVEPLQRIVPPVPGFLEALREATARHGIVLIFDEVVTGFRMAHGGAQEALGVVPDLCTLGKIIGGGLPLAAIAGRADIMAHFDRARAGPDGFTLQIGTLSGNPLAAAAGLKTLEILRRPGAYGQLRALGQTMMDTMTSALTDRGIAHRIVGDPVLFDVVFTAEEVRDYRDVLAGDGDLNAAFNRRLRELGIFKSPGKTYPCLALTDGDMDRVGDAVTRAARSLAPGPR